VKVTPPEVKLAATIGAKKPGNVAKVLVMPIRVAAKSGDISTCVEFNPEKQQPNKPIPNANNAILRVGLHLTSTTPIMQRAGPMYAMQYF